MGFDLTGVMPKKEIGSYFRNNIWWWRPLWSYCLDEKLITEEDYERGQYNDGYYIKEAQAIKIGIKLKHLVSQGKTKEYEENYKIHLSKLPERSCDLCNGTGTRNDKHTDHKDVKCNGCNGKGMREPWEKSYPFSTQNVEEFADFCLNSGGFEIW